MPLLKIKTEQRGERLDVILARMYPRYSRSFLQKLVKQGGVRFEGAAASNNYRVNPGDLFEIADFEKKMRPDKGMDSLALRATAAAGILPVAPGILFEDDSLLVINKPAGLVVHPAPGHRGATLIDWLRAHLGGTITKVFTDPARLGLVHRLDKETSGVLLIAKSIVAQTAISRQFLDRSVKKEYVAFAEGILSADRGVISAPVGRSRKQPSRMTVSGAGRPSETSFVVDATYPRRRSVHSKSPVEGAPEVSQVTLFPKTGRTHQIRVHLAALGHPIVGDHAYGSRGLWKKSFGVTRTLLHAFRLQVQHPETRKTVTFEAPWPADFLQARATFAKLTLALVLLVSGGAGAASGDDDTSSAPPKKVHHTSSASSGPSTASQIRTMRKELAAESDKVDAIKSELDSVQAGLEQLNLANRLRDLEKAVSEINGKTVNGTVSVEDLNTQLMDLTRKVKDQQDTLESMRDSLDRVQRQAIEARAQEDQNPPPAPAATTPEKNP